MPRNGADGERGPRPVPAVSGRRETQVHEVEGGEVRVGEAVDPREALRDARVPRVHLGRRLGESGGEAAGAEADVAEVGEAAVGVGRVGDVQPTGIESPRVLLRQERSQDVRSVGGHRLWLVGRVAYGQGCAVWG